MTIAGIPNVGVLKPVDIHLEPAIGMDVHVVHEQIRKEPSDTPSLEYS